MKRRGILGLVAGILLILSSAAHSFLGWQGLGNELSAAHVPPDLRFGVKVGWQFGGAAMLAFGVMVVGQAIRRLRGQEAPLLPEIATAALYLGFGGWALVASHGSPFFLVFIVPGLLLALSVIGRRQGPPAARSGLPGDG
jgi:hypothetical protein